MSAAQLYQLCSGRLSNSVSLNLITYGIYRPAVYAEIFPYHGKSVSCSGEDKDMTEPNAYWEGDEAVVVSISVWDGRL